MPKIQHYSRLSLAGATQQQIDTVANKLDITPEEVLFLSGEADPTKEKKFEGWILRQMAAKTVILPEDASRVKEVLTSFITYSRKKKLEHSDINAYRTIHDIEKELDTLFIKDFTPEIPLSIEKLKRFPGVTVHDGYAYVIAEVSEATSINILGKGTKWCTREDCPGGHNTALNYLRRSRTRALYLVYEKLEENFLKRMYQFTDDFTQFMNESDREVSFSSNDFPSELFEEIEGIFQEKKAYVSIGALVLKGERDGADVSLSDYIDSYRGDLDAESASDLLDIAEKISGSDIYYQNDGPSYDIWDLILLSEKRCSDVEDRLSEYPNLDLAYAVLHKKRNEKLDEYLFSKVREDNHINLLDVWEYYIEVVASELEETKESAADEEDLEEANTEQRRWEELLYTLPKTLDADEEDAEKFYTLLFQHSTHRFPWKVEREMKKFPALWEEYKKNRHKTPDLPELEDFVWED